jgi:hypothetical protein
MFALRASALSADFIVCVTYQGKLWIALLAKRLNPLFLTINRKKLHQVHVIDMLL